MLRTPRLGILRLPFCEMVVAGDGPGIRDHVRNTPPPRRIWQDPGVYLDGKRQHSGDCRAAAHRQLSPISSWSGIPRDFDCEPQGLACHRHQIERLRESIYDIRIRIVAHIPRLGRKRKVQAESHIRGGLRTPDKSLRHHGLPSPGVQTQRFHRLGNRNGSLGVGRIDAPPRNPHPLYILPLGNDGGSGAGKFKIIQQGIFLLAGERAVLSTVLPAERHRTGKKQEYVNQTFHFSSRIFLTSAIETGTYDRFSIL